MIYIKSLIRVCVILLFMGTASADSKILAIVGDQVITQNDLKDRYKFFLIENSQIEIKDKMQEQVLLRDILKSMIDEILLSQELDKHGITATEEEVSNAIAFIEKSQKLGKGKFFEYVTSLGLNKDYVLSQLKKGILWDKFLANVIAPKVQISDNEVFEFIAKNKPEALWVDYVTATGDPKHLTKAIINSKTCKAVLNSNNITTARKNSKFSGIDDYQLKKAISSTEENHPSYIFTYNKQKTFIFICEKKNLQNQLEAQNMLEQLREYKIRLQADYYLKNLAKNKYIEVFNLE